MFVDTERPNLFFISEANLKLIDVIGYDRILPKTMNKYKHARLILLARENLNYKIVEELMCDEVASIWVRPICKGLRKMTIGGIYRKQNVIYQDTPNNHDTLQYQERRWNLFIQQ